MNTNANILSSNNTFVLLSEYIEQMANNMRDDIATTRLNRPIAVAAFVNLNSDLKDTNQLGVQIAEHFINELQTIGLPVSDSNVVPGFTINDDGNFTHNLHFEELISNEKAGYVLTGTMINNKSGIIINARIISLESKVVVASSSKLLPSVLVTGKTI